MQVHQYCIDAFVQGSEMHRRPFNRTALAKSNYCALRTDDSTSLSTVIIWWKEGGLESLIPLSPCALCAVCYRSPLKALLYNPAYFHPKDSNSINAARYTTSRNLSHNYTDLQKKTCNYACLRALFIVQDSLLCANKKPKCTVMERLIANRWTVIYDYLLNIKFFSKKILDLWSDKFAINLAWIRVVACRHM